MGDFNRDGKLDLIVSGSTMLPGNGDGTFGSPVQVNTNTDLRGFVVGDFNGDGYQDLLDVANGFTTSQPLEMLLGKGDGTFQAPRQFWNLNTIPDNPVVGDFNHDGKLDLALTVNPNGVAVLLGDGGGAFAPPVIYPTDDLPSGLAVADLNGDGNLDLIATGLKVGVFLGKGDGTFPTRVDYPISFPGRVATGDFNGDGKLDVAVSAFGGGPGYLGLFMGNGDGTLQAPLIFTAYGVNPPLVARDFNGDGVDDPLVGGANGSLYLSRPVATVSPSALDFGTVAVGANSPAMEITVTNSGNGPMHVTGAAITVPFAISGTVCSSVLKRLENCTIPVIMSATAEGVQSGRVSIQEDALNSKPEVLLAGTAMTAKMTVTPAPPDFGNQAVMITSTAQSLTLKNTSLVAVTITSVTASAPFAVNSQCGDILAAGATCAVGVTFTPSATGQQSGTVTIADNVVGAPHLIAVSGTGVAALTMGAQAGSSTTVTVQSGATASYALSVTGGSGFSGVVSLSCDGAPTYASCTASPSSVTLTSGGSGNFSVARGYITASGNGVESWVWARSCRDGAGARHAGRSVGDVAVTEGTRNSGFPGRGVGSVDVRMRRRIIRRGYGSYDPQPGAWDVSADVDGEERAGKRSRGANSGSSIGWHLPRFPEADVDRNDINHFSAHRRHIGIGLNGRLMGNADFAFADGQSPPQNRINKRRD